MNQKLEDSKDYREALRHAVERLGSGSELTRYGIHDTTFQYLVLRGLNEILDALDPPLHAEDNSALFKFMKNCTEHWERGERWCNGKWVKDDAGSKGD